VLSSPDIAVAAAEAESCR